MSIFCIDNYIIKNTSGEILKFYLDKNNRINYDLYDINSTLVDQYLFSDDIVNEFSLDIDTKDRIHLIYITSEGNLNYSLYSNNKWAKKTLTRLDTRSNSYSGLVIKINKGNVHILYSFSNLINPKVWTIQHLIGTKGDWEKINVISFTSGKYTPTFSFDFDKFDNIHMIYTSVIENSSHIYYSFFNVASKKWNQVPKLLSEHQSTSSSPHLLVDKFDNIHALWKVGKNNDFEIKYKQLNQVGSYRNIWKDVILPVATQERIFPMILEEKDCLKIYITNEKKILSLVSRDYGSSWNIEYSLSIPSEISFQSAKYLTNFPLEKNNQKTSYVLFYLDENKLLIKQDLIDHIFSYSSLNLDIDKNTITESNESVGALENEDKENNIQIAESDKLNKFRSYFDDLINKNVILDSLSDISSDIKNIENINRSFATYLSDMDSTILALKDSIDFNNQCLMEVQKKIEELSNKPLKRGFFSRIFNRN